jgi:aminopeptidase N
VYLPVCAFFDGTVRNALGLTDTRGYWEVVGPHEVAHQWWGHTVGWDSYRDQWMSEGFAELSASIFIQSVYKPDKFQKFWHDELQLLTEPTRTGFRGIDMPITLGYRLATPKTGYDIPRRLIYPKGAFILHMVRMMMFDRQNGDKPFREMMQDFVTTYRNKPATTEDFKAMVEKHITPVMDLDRNHKMDWFFDEYVYGTALPQYRFEHSIQPAGEGQYKLHFKLTQSNVPDNFKMPVPLYIELANGTQVKLGSAPILGNNSMEKDVVLPLKEAPRRALINANYDVLALQN